MKKPSKKQFFLGMLLVLVIIQVFSIDKTNPSIDPEVDFYQTIDVPEDVSLLLHNACNDCHSHNTKYPWYTNVEPISWWVKGHINGGRQKLNFSEWGKYDSPRKSRKIDECIEFVEKKWMPLSSYTWMHPKAKLSDSDRQRLIAYFESIRN